jgi:hypothetical protein
VSATRRRAARRGYRRGSAHRHRRHGQRRAGTTFAGQGTGGVDAVVGATTATANAQGAYAVTQTLATLTKSQTVLDPIGGNRPVPGAVITYTIDDVALGHRHDHGRADRRHDSRETPRTSRTACTLDTVRPVRCPDADAGRFTGPAIAVSLGSVPAPPRTP